MQGSILGPLFFNLFIYDLFIFIERINICNIFNLQTILKDLEYDIQNILK